MSDPVSADILALLEALSPHQRATLDQLVAQQGQGCNLALPFRRALQDKGLIAPEVDRLTGGPRVCGCGLGHHCYVVPPAVLRAYGDGAAAGDSTALAQEEEGAPLQHAPLPSAPRPLAARREVRPTHWTRFTLPGLGYFTYKGTNYDRGQLLTLTGGPRDEQLERLGYVYPAPKEDTYLHAQCGACGLWFLTESFRDQHGRLRHSGRFAEDLDIAVGMQGQDGGAALRDITGDAEERRMQQQYPLHLDRTKATLEG